MAWLFDYSVFVTRWHCGDWPSWLGLSYIVADVCYAVSYAVIPLCIIWFWRQRRDGTILKGFVLWLFVAFIILCGLTHLCDAAAFRWPAYRLFTVIRIAGAVVSAATAWYLPGVVQTLVKQPSRQELHDARDQAQAALMVQEVLVDQLRSEKDTLIEKLNTVRREVEAHVWIASKNSMLDEISAMLRVASTPPKTPDTWE